MLTFAPRKAAKPKRQPTPEEIEKAQHLVWNEIAATIYFEMSTMDTEAVTGAAGYSRAALDYVAVSGMAMRLDRADRVKALAAAVEWGTAKQCKVLLAARVLYDSTGHGFHQFETRSISHSGDFRRVKWLGGDSFQCGCEALSECWHIKAARNVATLAGLYSAPNVEIAAAPVRAAVAAYPFDEDLTSVSSHIKRPDVTPNGGTFTDYGPPVEKPVKNAAVVRPGWAQQPASVDYTTMFGGDD